MYGIQNVLEMNIQNLTLLKRVLENKQAQKALVYLYSQSQSESTRNGRCGMEVGMAREKDQGAVFKYFLKEKIDLDIDNQLPEDYRIGTSKISAKHSSGKVGTAVKAKWTSADISVKDAIKGMIEAEDDYYPNLLLTYLGNTITFICIEAEQNKHVIKSLKEDAFTVPKGNSRGIEYSTKAMKMLLEKEFFRITIDNVDLKGGANPIDRRIQTLETLGITVEEEL